MMTIYNEVNALSRAINAIEGALYSSPSICFQSEPTLNDLKSVLPTDDKQLNFVNKFGKEFYQVCNTYYLLDMHAEKVLENLNLLLDNTK
jgi:hypothetical protein